MAPGHVRVAAGVGAYVPAGQTVSLGVEAVSLARRAAEAAARKEAFVWTPADERTLLGASLALAIFPPAPVAEVSVRAGVLEHLDLGARLSSTAVRIDGKYRLFHASNRPAAVARAGASEAGAQAGGGPPPPRTWQPAWTERIEPSATSTDVAVFVGASRSLLKNPVLQALEYVRLGNFSRWDLEAAVVASHDFAAFLGVYAAPTYVFATTTVDQTLVRLSQGATEVLRTELTLPAKLDAHFVGATAGVRIGAPWLSLFAELYGGVTFARVRVLGELRELGGLTIYPAAGLAGEI